MITALIGWCLLGILVGLAFFLLLKVLQRFQKQAHEGELTSILLIQKEIESLRESMRTVLETNTQWIQQQLHQITQQVSEQLRGNAMLLEQASRHMGERLEGAHRVVSEVYGRLGKLEEANQRIFEIGKDISSLQEILKAPKLRGGLGEFFLGDLLAQILPAERYILQHTFRSGEKVDAVIVLNQGLVPIDAKFPLENFRRFIEASEEPERRRLRKQFVVDVRKHIDSITTKYILPDEGTFDFALMYIPAENVYYETIIKDERAGDESSLAQYALMRKIIPTSPGSFYAYLQVILLGLKGLRIEETAQDILKNLARLHGELARFSAEFEKLGFHLTNSLATHERCAKKLERFEQKLQVLDRSSGEGDLPDSQEPMPHSTSL